MKLSEMTNEELASNIEDIANVLPEYGPFQFTDELNEAAKRLRDIDLLKSSYESRFFKIKKAIILVEKKDMVK